MGLDFNSFLEIKPIAIELAKGVLILEYDNFCIEGGADKIGVDMIIIMRISVVDGMRFNTEEGSFVIVKPKTILSCFISGISVGDIFPLISLHIVSQLYNSNSYLKNQYRGWGWGWPTSPGAR